MCGDRDTTAALRGSTKPRSRGGKHRPVYLTRDPRMQLFPYIVFRFSHSGVSIRISNGPSRHVSRTLLQAALLVLRISILRRLLTFYATMITMLGLCLCLFIAHSVASSTEQVRFLPPASCSGTHDRDYQRSKLYCGIVVEQHDLLRSGHMSQYDQAAKHEEQVLPALP
jgi:hypothetical protein